MEKYIKEILVTRRADVHHPRFFLDFPYFGGRVCQIVWRNFENFDSNSATPPPQSSTAAFLPQHSQNT